MKIVLDTNVFVSALLTPYGNSAKVLNLILSDIIKLVYDNDVLSEYINVSHRKKFKIDLNYVSILIDFIQYESIFTLTVPCSHNKAFTDPDDRKFYDLLKSSNANYLVTGNLRHFPKETNIINPTDFLSVFPCSV
jgi:putative PIN family toxin of toxin-antitoxin system